jgi:formate hydrogenlyase subunit 6/NADH:ubiquinone oxidoreductase subunit I
MSYFSNIASAALTIFEGLTITASHMLRRPITVQYPDRTIEPVKELLFPRYRGFLSVDMNICTACTLCKTSCPIQCIEIKIDKISAGEKQQEAKSRQQSAMSGEQTAPVQRVITKFDVDIGKCMFCGLCVEACPTGAIHFTREFEAATSDLNDLTFKFVDEGKCVVPYKKGSA